MLARTTIRDAYHKLKPNYGDYILAFKLDDVYEFVLGDAIALKEALGDVQYDNTVEYHRLKVSVNGIMVFFTRVCAKGFKIALVTRTIGSSGKAKYEVVAKSDDYTDVDPRYGFDIMSMLQ